MLSTRRPRPERATRHTRSIPAPPLYFSHIGEGGDGATAADLLVALNAFITTEITPVQLRYDESVVRLKIRQTWIREYAGFDQPGPEYQRYLREIGEEMTLQETLNKSLKDLKTKRRNLTNAYEDQRTQENPPKPRKLTKEEKRHFNKHEL